MTEEEFYKLDWRKRCHLNMAKECSTTWQTEDGRFAICDHTIRKGEFEYGRTYRHYMIDGNVYKSRKKFLVALAKIELPIEQSH